jgi:hypothetical protein
MRMTALLLMTTLLCACAARPVAPREYLDEQTAATITVVAEPVIFVTQTPRNVDGTVRTDANRDYIELYGLDVNRMGRHRQYLAVMKWQAPDETGSAPPILSLLIGGSTLELQATGDDPRALGLAQPVSRSSSKSSSWWYFPADASTLRSIASARELAATLTVNTQPFDYVLFSDGRAQLSALTEGLVP